METTSATHGETPASAAASAARPHLSIIIPICNEEESLPVLVPRLLEVLSDLSHSTEVLAIDDGSTDRSFEILSKTAAGLKATAYTSPSLSHFGRSLPASRTRPSWHSRDSSPSLSSPMSGCADGCRYL